MLQQQLDGVKRVAISTYSFCRPEFGSLQARCPSRMRGLRLAEHAPIEGTADHQNMTI